MRTTEDVAKDILHELKMLVDMNGRSMLTDDELVYVIKTIIDKELK